MENKLLRYTLRVDRILFQKFRYIATSEMRSANKEIEQYLKKRIAISPSFCYNKGKWRKRIMLFEWDDEKEKKNRSKHGIDFRTAALVFGDENRIEKYDELHSSEEDRYITIGEIHGTAVVVVVVYTERRKAIRIISARAATKREKEAYYHANQY